MTKNIKKRALVGASWVVASYGLSQIIRLTSTLVLTRLLVPELFGVMALANVFIFGLDLFSDLGLGPGIIRSPRSNESAFYNTAWTIQVIRGVLLCCLTFIVAWPVAEFYEKPILTLIIPAIGLGFIVSGLNSTAIFSLNKELKLGKLAIMDLSIQMFALVCTITIAYGYRNVWALVAGRLVAAVLRTVWSHFLDPTIRNRFYFDKSAANELFSFGKWVFVSTAMTLLATQADKLLLGKLFSLALLGIYSIAVSFSEVPKQIVIRLGGKVIFPLISQFAYLPRHELRLKILHKRKLLLPPLAILVAFLACFGDVLIVTVYDERYVQAGWMLPLLALGMWPLLLYATIDRCLYVVGKPKFPAMGNFLKFLWMIVCLPSFYMLAGNLGVVLAVALNDAPMYLVVNYGLRREKLSGMGQDGWATFMLLVIIGCLVLFRYYIGMGLPGMALYVP